MKVIDLAEDCERCADEKRNEEIMASLEKEKKTSCTLCSSKITEDDRNKVVSGEYTKSLLKENDREDFKVWYETITRFSQQLRDSLLSSDSFIARMIEIHNNLKHYDMKKDNGQVVRMIQDMENLAKMAKVDMELIIRTLELIEGKVHGNG